MLPRTFNLNNAVQLTDQEDIEEDYDPGSEGMSGGSGDSSEEEEYEDVDAAADVGDLVAEELGSEAEDVVPDPNDQEQL